MSPDLAQPARASSSARRDLALLALALVAAGLNVILGKVQVDFPINQNHQLPVVMRLWDHRAFPGDQFVDTLFRAPHLFWDGVAALLTPATLDAGLLALFLVFKVLYFVALAACAAQLAPRRPLLAAVATLVLFLPGRQPLVGGDTYNWSYLTHTQAAQALVLVAAACLLRGASWRASLAMALAIFANPVLGVLGLALYLPLALTTLGGTPRQWRQWVGSLSRSWSPDLPEVAPAFSGSVATRSSAVGCTAALAARFLLPALALLPTVMAAAARADVALPAAWPAWIYEHYAMHHQPQREPLFSHLLLAGLSVGQLMLLGRLPARFRLGVAAAIAAFWATYLVGYVGVVGLRLPILLQLQPFRVTAVTLPFLSATLAASLVGSRDALPRGWAPSALLLYGALLVTNFVQHDAELGAPVVGAAVVLHLLCLAVLHTRDARHGSRLRVAARGLALASAAVPIVFMTACIVCFAVGDWFPRAPLPAPMALLGAIVVALGVLFLVAPARRLRLEVAAVVVAAATMVGWAIHLVPYMNSKGESAWRADPKPALRDIGAWIDANTPDGARLATPHGIGLLGIRVAARRTCLLAELDEAGVYYDPRFLAEWETRNARLGIAPSAAFLAGRNPDYLIALDDYGATHLILPGTSGPRTLPGWRQAFSNGAYRVLERAPAPSLTN